MSYPSTPSSHTTHGGQDVFDAGNAWAAVCPSIDESYCVSQPMGWPSEIGLGLPSTQTATQHMLVDPSLGAFNTFMPSSWPSSMGILLPSSTYRETIRHDSFMQNCYPQSAFLPTQPMTTWDVSGSGVASFRPSYEMSSGESDFSVSSQTSCTPSSPPYAHSEGCFPRRSSPIVKIEEEYNPLTPRLSSISGSVSPRTRQSHVNPGDVYNPPNVEVDQQPQTPPLVPVKLEEDTKPVLRPRPAGERRSDASAQETRRAFDEDRRKRGYTTPTNAVCSCDECGKLFQRVSNLRAHMDTHKPDREQPWACQFYGCTRRFVRKTDMTRHQESVSRLTCPRL